MHRLHMLQIYARSRDFEDSVFWPSTISSWICQPSLSLWSSDQLLSTVSRVNLTSHNWSMCFRLFFRGHPGMPSHYPPETLRSSVGYIQAPLKIILLSFHRFLAHASDLWPLTRQTYFQIFTKRIEVSMDHQINRIPRLKEINQMLSFHGKNIHDISFKPW